MKKILAILLVASMLVLALTGCGKSEKAKSTTEKPTEKPVWTQKGDFAVAYFQEDTLE